MEKGQTYSLVLDLLSLAPLEGSAVALVLETLGGDQPLDLGSLGVGLLALALGLDLAADDVLADLVVVIRISFSKGKCVLLGICRPLSRCLPFPQDRSKPGWKVLAERTTGGGAKAGTREAPSHSLPGHADRVGDDRV